MNFKEKMIEKYEEMLLLKESLGYCRNTYSHFVVPFIEYCATNFEDALAYNFVGDKMKVGS